MNALDKFAVLRRTFSNWPLVILDRGRLRETVVYRTRPGSVVKCRSGTSDSAEAVVVLGGLEYPRHLVRLGADDVVIDVGANIGAFSLYAAEVNRGIEFHGFAIEPHAPTYALLADNVAANAHAARNVRTFELAVAGREGQVFLATDVPPDRVHLAESGSPVTATTLSGFCRTEGIATVALLKIDIEGAEYEVVEADAAFLAEHVRSILVEYHDLDELRRLPRLLAALEPSFETALLHTRGLSGVVHARNRSL